MVTGMMGLYVARIYEEVRGRPLYIVRDAYGFGFPAPGPPAGRMMEAPTGVSR
jgi:hypothetical protein